MPLPFARSADLLLYPFAATITIPNAIKSMAFLTEGAGYSAMSASFNRIRNVISLGSSD